MVQLNVLLSCPPVEVVPQVEGAFTDEVAVGILPKVPDGCCHLVGRGREKERGGSGRPVYCTLGGREYGAYQISHFLQSLGSDVSVLQAIAALDSAQFYLKVL